ncbi:glycerophosphodiester phosphodiesterase [Candidatus Moduliflexota bacterium]
MITKQTSPLIVAHRGARKMAPDNTRAAFDRAVLCGVAGIEFDVQLTADGHPVLYHDRTLARVGGGRRRVGECSLDYLRSLDWGGWFSPSFRGESPVLLHEALRRYGSRMRLFVEIKSREADRAAGRHQILTARVLEQIRADVPPHRVKNGVFILSFDRDVLDIAAGIEPEIQYVLNVEKGDGLERSLRPRLAKLHGCSIPVRHLTPSFARDLRRRGLLLLTYSCNQPYQLERARKCGADVVMTDDPCRIVPLTRGRYGP